MGVAVNLVLGNSWCKKIGAVIDYPAKYLRINGHPDMQKFDLRFHKLRDEACNFWRGAFLSPGGI